MEVVVVLAVLCVLAVLAGRWGVDSRELPPSKEQELAALGLTWDQPAPTRTFDLEWAADRLAERRREAAHARLVHQAGGHGRSLRGRLAALLTAAAARLDPETGIVDGRAAMRSGADRGLWIQRSN
jgi:hypothetical protein